MLTDDVIKRKIFLDSIKGIRNINYNKDVYIDPTTRTIYPLRDIDLLTIQYPLFDDNNNVAPMYATYYYQNRRAMIISRGRYHRYAILLSDWKIAASKRDRVKSGWAEYLPAVSKDDDGRVANGFKRFSFLRENKPSQKFCEVVREIPKRGKTELFFGKIPVEGTLVDTSDFKGQSEDWIFTISFYDDADKKIQSNHTTYPCITYPYTTIHDLHMLLNN